MSTELVIKAGTAGRLQMTAGQSLEIINVCGSQVLDLFAFCCPEHREHLSPAHTRLMLRKLTLAPGVRLYSVRRNPLLEMVADSSPGRHDMLIPACDPDGYRLSFGETEHASCRENLLRAVADLGIPYEHLPDPINLFQSVDIGTGGLLTLGCSTARAGDSVVLRALVPLIVVGSACPYDRFGVNGEAPTDMLFRVTDGSDGGAVAYAGPSSR